MEKKLRKIYAFLRKIYFSRKMHVTFGKKSEIDTTTVFEGKSRVMGKVLDSRIAEATYIAGDLLTCVVGFGTYITGETRLENCKIGKYCSIGHRVMTIRGQHPVCDWVAMSPVFYAKNTPLGFSLVKENLFEEYKWIDPEKKYAVEIGNDVWIGDDVRLMEGIRIGNGAVIAAGAVVVSDVEPYAIYGGVPAKKIRFRFSETEIAKLNELQWWDRDLPWLEQHVNMFQDIRKLSEMAENDTRKG